MSFTKEIWLKTMPHHHAFLSPIRSNKNVQFYNEEENIEDSIQVKRSKQAINESGYTKDNVIALVNAYNQQLRYREAIKTIEEALNTFKDDYDLIRLLAIRKLTICEFEESKRLFEFLYERTDDLLDINYRLGLCNFYLHNYKEAYKFFKECIPLCEYDLDMQIASVYWLIMSSIEMGELIEESIREYKECFVLHHAGYEYAIRLFIGDSPKEFEKISKSDNLTRIMYLFGLYEFYNYKKDKKKQEAVLHKAIEIDEFFGSFSYLGFMSIISK